MIARVKVIKFEGPMDIIDYVNDGIAPTKRQVVQLLKPVHTPKPEAEDGVVLEPWEEELYAAYDKVPEEARPFFEEVIKHLHREKQKKQAWTLVGVGIGVLLAALLMVEVKD